MTSIKNAEAVHGLGRAWFSSVREIAESSDAYAMTDVMWKIVDEASSDPSRIDLRLRLLTFLRAHELKRPK